MGGAEEQRAIISSELYWFGGLRDSNCHNIPSAEPLQAEEPAESSDSKRRIRAYYDEQGRWTVSIDPVDGCLIGQVEIVEPEGTDC